jgi:hypothetical protein
MRAARKLKPKKKPKKALANGDAADQPSLPPELVLPSPAGHLKMRTVLVVPEVSHAAASHLRQFGEDDAIRPLLRPLEARLLEPLVYLLQTLAEPTKAEADPHAGEGKKAQKKAARERRREQLSLALSIMPSVVKLAGTCAVPAKEEAPGGVATAGAAVLGLAARAQSPDVLLAADAAARRGSAVRRLKGLPAAAAAAAPSEAAAPAEEEAAAKVPWAMVRQSSRGEALAAETRGMRRSSSTPAAPTLRDMVLVSAVRRVKLLVSTLKNSCAQPAD